jgi:hypothetical protein
MVMVKIGWRIQSVGLFVKILVFVWNFYILNSNVAKILCGNTQFPAVGLIYQLLGGDTNCLETNICWLSLLFGLKIVVEE